MLTYCDTLRRILLALTAFLLTSLLTAVTSSASTLEQSVKRSAPGRHAVVKRRMIIVYRVVERTEPAPAPVVPYPKEPPITDSSDLNPAIGITPSLARTLITKAEQAAQAKDDQFPSRYVLRRNLIPAPHTSSLPGNSYISTPDLYGGWLADDTYWSTYLHKKPKFTIQSAANGLVDYSLDFFVVLAHNKLDAKATPRFLLTDDVGKSIACTQSIALSRNSLDNDDLWNASFWLYNAQGTPIITDRASRLTLHVYRPSGELVAIYRLTPPKPDPSVRIAEAGTALGGILLLVPVIISLAQWRGAKLRATEQLDLARQVN